MTFNVYIYEGTTSGEELSHELAKDAVINYCSQKGIDFNDKVNRWSEAERGKPYFADLPVHFNVSHSGMLWVCMVGDAPCGIDIQVGQEMNVRKYDNIIRRYYTPNEGFYGKMPDFVGSDGRLNIEVTLPGTGEKVYVKDEPIGPDIYLAYCTAGEDDDIRFVE